ncbi:MAG TPA: MarR family winged helix-turn-helix transcriptional regulator [Mycobacteriales bacterium]|nr:MarR family winged helix-turn-helix transcriptional regulator [Mycobacteriales bacterium]
MPPAPEPDSAGFLLALIGVAVAGRFARRLDPLGLEPRQVGLMRAVAATQGQSQQSLGERLRIPPSRMVTLVDDLERRNVVERRRNPADRRAHALYLTDAGQRLLTRVMCLAGEHEAEVCAALSGPEHDQMVALLRQVASNLGLLDPASLDSAPPE